MKDVLTDGLARDIGGWIGRDLDACLENGLLTAVKPLKDPGSYVNKEISVWQIGAGDHVEIAAIEKE